MYDKKKHTVVIVDNNPLTYNSLDIALDESDFGVVDYQSGKQAIHLCVSIKPVF